MAWSHKGGFLGWMLHVHLLHPVALQPALVPAGPGPELGMLSTSPPNSQLQTESHFSHPHKNKAIKCSGISIWLLSNSSV